MKKTIFILIGVICILMSAFSQVKKRVTPQSSNVQSGIHKITVLEAESAKLITGAFKAVS